MKTLLFIVPTRENAGTNSSFSCLYNKLKKKYKIRVLVMQSIGTGTYEFLQEAYTPGLLDAYLQDFSKLKGWKKILSLFLKLIKRFALVAKFDFQTVFFKFVARRIETLSHIDFVIGYQEGVAMKLAAQFENPNKITWIHSDYVRAFPTTLDELELYEKFQKIICVSNYTCNRFIARYPALIGKTLVLYNLIDIVHIQNLMKEPVKDMRFDQSHFTIITLGRMDPIKRFAIIPCVAKKIKDRGLDFKWYILGGPQNDIYRDVKNKISEYGVEDCVILMGNQNNPYSYLHNSQLLVTTSSSEACPMIFNEAMVCGVPILSTDFGSSREFIKDGINGYVTPVEDLDIVLTKILQKEIDCRVTESYMYNFFVEYNQKIISDVSLLFS